MTFVNIEADLCNERPGSRKLGQGKARDGELTDAHLTDGKDPAVPLLSGRIRCSALRTGYGLLRNGMLTFSTRFHHSSKPRLRLNRIVLLSLVLLYHSGFLEIYSERYPIAKKFSQGKTNRFS